MIYGQFAVVVVNGALDGKTTGAHGAVAVDAFRDVDLHKKRMVRHLTLPLLWQTTS